MAVAAKYSTKTITITIGTDVTDGDWGSLAGTTINAATISLISLSPTQAKFLLLAVHS